jgi:hypothetical protein
MGCDFCGQICATTTKNTIDAISAMCYLWLVNRNDQKKLIDSYSGKCYIVIYEKETVKEKRLWKKN